MWSTGRDEFRLEDFLAPGTGAGSVVAFAASGVRAFMPHQGVPDLYMYDSYHSGSMI